jgi:hypothetical protein
MKRRKCSLLTGISISAVLVGVVMAGLFAPKAHASTQETCTVSNVTWQTLYSFGGTTINTDLMQLSCTDGKGFNAYVGTTANPPAANSCYVELDTAKSWAALATAARISGNTLTIWYNTVACPGNGSALVPVSVGMN